MSGAEFLAVIGGISAILGIAEVITDVYKTVKDLHGLPEAFSVVAGRLPIVRDILESAKQHINAEKDEAVCKGVKHIVEQCETKAKILKDIFEQVKPKDGAWKVEQYYKAVKAKGKGSKVETLMAQILEDVQLLDSQHGMNTATKPQQEEILAAIKELSEVKSSVPDSEFQDPGVTMTHYGRGDVQYTHGDSYDTSGGPMFKGGDHQTINYVNASPESDKESCMRALFLTNPRDDRDKLIQTKGSRVDGTCEWIKTNKLYNSWIHSHSQLLWLSGGPGKGKTMLSIFLAEELERTAKDSQDVLFLQYFCDNKDEKRNTAVAIIRGMIFQLLQLRPKLIDHILPSFQIQKESLFTSSSFETLWRIFETMLCDPVLGAVYCVLDGLDECDEASLEVLLNKFKALFSTKFGESSACHLNLIVVSRDLPDFIPEVLSSFPRIRLDPDADTEVNDDIHRFVEVKVDELSAYRRYPELLRVRVKEVFQNRAQGTFLWVGIVARALRKYKATEVEKALDLFPSGLEELYARMLLQIDDNRRETAAKILRWVVMAVRPLTLSELSAAIETAVMPSATFNCVEVMRDQVLHCGYFLTINKDEVGLIHQSAQDYLLRKTLDSNPELEVFRVKEEVGNLEITRKCLDYLQNGALTDRKVNLQTNTSHLKAFPLLSYAALHWPEHARSLARSEDIFDLSLPFYHKKSRIRESWLETYWAAKTLGRLPASFTLLHLASHFGILPLAENLLFKKGLINRVKRLLYLNKKDGQRRTALHRAAEGGHEAVVRLLLEKGADVEAKDDYGGTALHRAVEGGHEAVVRLLLEKGADVEAKDNYGGTALRWAAWDGHEAVVRLLLEKGADVEAKDNDGGTALRWAAGGHEAVVRLLLEKGADVEAKDNDGGTALHWAAGGGHEAVVRLLLEKGADVEAKDDYGDTALYRAARCGHGAVWRLLTPLSLNS